jgi:hypothetical protein
VRWAPSKAEAYKVLGVSTTHQGSEPARAVLSSARSRCSAAAPPRRRRPERVEQLDLDASHCLPARAGHFGGSAQEVIYVVALRSFGIRRLASRSDSSTDLMLDAAAGSSKTLL